MTDMVKNMRQWAKQHEWIVQLVNDITRIEGLLAAENEAQARYDAIRAKSDDLIAEQKLAEESIAAAVAAAQQKIDDADKYVVEARLDADSIITKAKSDADNVTASALKRSDQLIATAEQRIATSEVEIGENSDFLKIQAEKIAEAEAERDAIYADIEKAKAKAKAAFEGIGS